MAVTPPTVVSGIEDDVDETARKAELAGGTVIIAPMDVMPAGLCWLRYDSCDRHLTVSRMLILHLR